ncbi:MAG: pseudouridine synthase [Terriglobia bacterium]
MQERLQKIISAAGLASRRKAEEWITGGRVTVNGQVVTQLGSKADPDADHIRVGSRSLRIPDHHAYYLLHKPVGYVSTVRDPERRPTVLSLMRRVKERVYPVGRLDYHTSGLMILTNDGELANFLMSRASAVPRTYHAKLSRDPDPAALARLEQGVVLDGRRTAPARIRALASHSRNPKPWYEVMLVEGRYHQVRRMFERIGLSVVKLKRVRIAFLELEGIPPGKFREITPAEVERLRKLRASKTVASDQ